MEIWKKINGYEGYEVSSYGNVRSLERMAWNGKAWHKLSGRDLNRNYDTHRYFIVSLCKDGLPKKFRVHSLVANAFLEKPIIIGKLEIDHIDNDKTNNKVENLQFISQRENTIKGIKREKTSKYTGVCWHKGHQKWRAGTHFKDLKVSKYFNDEHEAHLWYENKIKEYYG